MAKKQGESVHVRLPLETLEEVDALARELGESRSEAVRALMAPSIKRRINARTRGRLVSALDEAAQRLAEELPDVGEEERAIILALVAELRELDARLDALDAAVGATP